MKYLLLCCFFVGTVLTNLQAAPYHPESAIARSNIEHFTVTGSHIQGNSEHGRVMKISLNAEDIAKRATNSFADILRGLPGVDVFQQGGTGGLTFLSLRGGDPNFVTILLDGVKVNDPTNSRGGAFDLTTIDPLTVEKVELFYGSYSTVYGSDALAGVLSITTKNSGDNIVSAKYGTSGAYGGSVFANTTFGEFADFSINGSYQKDDHSTFGNHYFHKQLSAKISGAEHQSLYWQLLTFYAQGENQAFPEDSGGERLAVIRTPELSEFHQQNSALKLGYLANEALDIELTASSSSREQKNDHPGIISGVLDGVPEMLSDTDYRRNEITLVSRFQISDPLNFAAGASYVSERGKMASLLNFGVWLPADYQLKRHSTAWFAEGAYDGIQNLQLTAGVRYQKSKQLSVTTSRLLAKYAITQETEFNVQYSEGFKFPSFFALGHPFVGNSELKPEQSKNYQIALRSDFLGGALTLTNSIYLNRFTDLVDFDPVAFTNVNRSKVNAKGAEVVADYRLNPQFAVTGLISYNDTEIEDSDDKLRRRPKIKASFIVDYLPLDSLTLSARFTVNGDYYDSSIATGRVKMQGSDRLDLSANWQVTKPLALRLSVGNALNDDSEYAVGFNNDGRMLNIAMSYGF